MTDQPATPPEPTIVEPVPVPDKGGWVDGEEGQVLPTPAPKPKRTTSKAAS